MNYLGTISADQISATAKKHVCGYFYVTDIGNTTRLVAMGDKNKIEGKIQETVSTINALPDSVFCITFKKSNAKTAAEFPYYLTKTSTSNQASTSTPQTIINTPFEPARTMSEALKDAHELATLKADNKRLQDELTRLKMEFDTLKTETEEEKEGMSEAPATIDKISGFMKEVLPTFMPLAEKYFEIAEKKLALQAMAINQRQTQALAPQKLKHPFRPFWSLENTTKTEQYINWLETLNDNQYNAELNDIKVKAPELYNIVCSTFEPNNENEQA